MTTASSFPLRLQTVFFVVAKNRPKNWRGAWVTKMMQNFNHATTCTRKKYTEEQGNVRDVLKEESPNRRENQTLHNTAGEPIEFQLLLRWVPVSHKAKSSKYSIGNEPFGTTKGRERCAGGGVGGCGGDWTNISETRRSLPASQIMCVCTRSLQ